MFFENSNEITNFVNVSYKRMWRFWAQFIQIIRKKSDKICFGEKS